MVEAVVADAEALLEAHHRHGELTFFSCANGTKLEKKVARMHSTCAIVLAQRPCFLESARFPPETQEEPWNLAGELWIGEGVRPVGARRARLRNRRRRGVGNRIRRRRRRVP